jgi:hypothetical protein
MLPSVEKQLWKSVMDMSQDGLCDDDVVSLCRLKKTLKIS